MMCIDMRAQHMAYMHIVKKNKGKILFLILRNKIKSRGGREKSGGKLPKMVDLIAVALYACG